MDLSVVIAAGDAASLDRTLASLGPQGIDVVVAPFGDFVPESVRPPIRTARASRTPYGAFNAGVALAQGSQVMLLEGGVALGPRALEQLTSGLGSGVGIALPTIADGAGRVVSGGRAIRQARMSPICFEVAVLRAGEAVDERARPEDVSLATSSCMLLERSLFAELGGFAETFLDALADVDLSLGARARGLRISCVRAAVANVLPGHVGGDDPLRVSIARALLDEKWRGRIAPLLEPPRPDLRETRVAPERYFDLPGPVRSVAAFVHGDVADAQALAHALERSGIPLERIVWNAASEPPPLTVPVRVDRSATTTAARSAMELRGERAIAFLDAARPPQPGWLAELVRELSWGADVVAATFVESVPEERVVPACDGRASLVALGEIPQHLRLDERQELDDALVDLLARVRPCGLAVRAADAARFVPSIDAQRTSFAVNREAPSARADGLASIIMLSWNAPNYTKLALDSIRAYTRHPHEIIIVDNGSGAETTDWLKSLDGVRVIYNTTNRGFAGGNNQGIAAANGEYIVVLNNDVIVTEGWLEDLIDALRRNPLTGVSAPRSNRVAGAQLVSDADYPDVAAMHRLAAERRRRWRKTGFYVDRAIGFCLCIDRRVIDEIGGIDERFGAGNFEDDDFSLRARAAGYKIYVCDDVFIHHFGSVTFSANNVDWQASMNQNWVTFARKWGLPEQYPASGYLPQPLIARGFDRALHYVPLAAPSVPEAEREERSPVMERKTTRVRFAAVVRDEADWSSVGAFARRFARAFETDADVTLEIAACGILDAATLGERVSRLLERHGLEEARIAEIGIDDVEDVDAWLAELGPALLVRAQTGAFGSAFDHLQIIAETSPSGLRRALVKLSALA